MKHLELLKFPTYEPSFSFHFFLQFLFFNLFSFPSWRYLHYYGNSDISDMGEAEQDPYQWFETDFTKWNEGENKYCFNWAYT